MVNLISVNFLEMFVLLFLVVVIRGVTPRVLTDEEYYKLPALFHLDNYQKCFSRSDGLYCLGTFHITPIGEPNVLYDSIKEYTSEINTFNRTLIHRGYCVSSRCPDLNTTQLHLRYEQCTSHLMSEQLLKPRLTKLHYCRTKGEERENVAPDTAKLLFLVLACGILVLNITGTVYDVKTKNNDKKIQALVAWSVRMNWRQLTGSHKTTIRPSPLTALHGIRVGIMICACLVHSSVLHFMMYSYNPRTLEQIMMHPLSMLIQNSSSLEQMLFAISGFLLALNIHYRWKKYPNSFGLMVFVIVQRIFRLLPLFILAVGFAATWWPAMSDGPLWSAYVGRESNICRQKFWTHLLFVNNLVEPEKLCILSTWYMAVDMQLYIISTIILLMVIRLSNLKLLVLVVVFVGSVLLNTILTYVFDWAPMLYFTTSSENVRNLFRDQPSFVGLYISPWGNLPVYLVGLIAGHVYCRKMDSDTVLTNCIDRFKWLLKITSVVSPPVFVAWIVLGYYFQHIKNKVFVIAYATFERSIFQIVFLLSYVALSIVGGFPIQILGWRGWHVLSNLSYSVMLFHWLVSLYIVASTPQPITTSLNDFGIHGFITAFYTFLLAVPITILVEIPMKKMFDIITS